MLVALDAIVYQDTATNMLTKIDTSSYSKLTDILKRNIAACNVGERTSVEYITASMRLHDSQGGIGVYVDDADDPHLLLIVSAGKFGVLNEKVCYVNTLYVDPDRRSSFDRAAVVDAINLFARSQDCNVIFGSSWTFRGSVDSSTFWKSFGAEEQETIHVKFM